MNLDTLVPRVHDFLHLGDGRHIKTTIYNLEYFGNSFSRSGNRKHSRGRAEG